jgi:quercetin dioxygenase-like cupin family protein
VGGKSMKHQSERFLFGKRQEKEIVGEGITRQLLGYDDSLLLARVVFEHGAIGYEHAHPHSQVTYVESGVFDFTVGSEAQRLQAGDAVYIPPGENHGAVCVEGGVLLDIFSPIREDFLEETQT